MGPAPPDCPGTNIHAWCCTSWAIRDCGPGQYVMPEGRGGPKRPHHPRSANRSSADTPVSICADLQVRSQTAVSPHLPSPVDSSSKPLEASQPPGLGFFRKVVPTGTVLPPGSFKDAVPEPRARGFHHPTGPSGQNGNTRTQWRVLFIPFDSLPRRGLRQPWISGGKDGVQVICLETPPTVIYPFRSPPQRCFWGTLVPI